ncbi:MAG: hypothetical protein Q6K80_12855 [Thermostichus sp. DG_1_6_bins_120]
MLTYASNPDSPTQSLAAVVEQVLRQGFLSWGQENLINELLFRQPCSELDLEMLDRLTTALLNRQISVEQDLVWPEQMA